MAIVPWQEQQQIQRNGGIFERIASAALAPRQANQKQNNISTNVTAEDIGIGVDGNLNKSPKEALIQLSRMAVTEGLDPVMKAKLRMAEKMTKAAAEDAKLFTGLQKSIGGNLATIYTEQIEQKANMMKLSEKVAGAEVEHLGAIQEHSENMGDKRKEAREKLAAIEVVSFAF